MHAQFAMQSQTKNPAVVQPFLHKCFDSISSLDLVVTRDSSGGTITDAVAMRSSDGEKVTLDKIVRTRQAVETWLALLEARMKSSLMDLGTRCLQALEHASMLVNQGH